MTNHNISFGERSGTHDLVRKLSMMYDANDVTYRQLGRSEGGGRAGNRRWSRPI